MDEARDLLRDVKRRRQISPHKGVLKKATTNICSKPLKRLRFAEDCNEIYEIPMLDSPASRIVMPMPADTFVAKGSGEERKSVDWIKEATEAVVGSFNSAIHCEVESGTIAEEVRGDDLVDSTRSPMALSEPYDIANSRTDAALTNSTLEKLRALAAAMPTRGVALPPSKPTTMLSDQALDSLLWED